MKAKHWRSICWFEQSMRCVLITPFGLPVEPEVNRNLAMVSGPTRAAAASTAGVARTLRLANRVAPAFQDSYRLDVLNRVC